MLKRLLLTLLVVIALAFFALNASAEENAERQRTLAVTYFTVSSYNTEQTIIGAKIDEATRKLIEENSSHQGEIRTYTLLLQRGLQGIYSIKQECDSENSPKYIKSGNIEIITAEELNYDIGTAKYTYMDLTTSEQISSRIVLEKEFLVQETLKPKNWIIGTETKEILGKECTKATIVIPSEIMSSSSDENSYPKEISYTAWFCRDIPAAIGPKGFYGLPGLILQIESEHDYTTTAIKTEYLPNDTRIRRPEGKIITQKKYEQILEDVLKKIEDDTVLETTGWEIK